MIFIFGQRPTALAFSVRTGSTEPASGGAALPPQQAIQPGTLEPGKMPMEVAASVCAYTQADSCVMSWTTPLKHVISIRYNDFAK
jgi:hypothetical protein